LNLAARIGLDEAARRRAAAAIAERAAGNFQYADSVIGELNSGELQLDDLDHLPRELSNLYYRFADRRFPQPGDFNTARRILGVLLAAREPLTREQLGAMTGLDRDGLMAALDALSCFLTWDLGAGEDRVYRMAHKSISDWLIAPPGGFDRFKVDRAEGRDAVLVYCRDAASRRDRYALTHLVAHLLEKGDVPAALTALRGGFFAARHDRVDPRFDLDDSQAVVAELIAAQDKASIVALSTTDNVWQRDGIAAALSLAPAGADQFVDSVVDALLRVE